ncbi:MAG: DUF2849 domain-containing protein [Defluviicoccus sp.]|nr:MAG: DUF2849 domain-containing protein [Defluviicoccus sp.]
MSETKGLDRTTDEAALAISAARGGRGTALKVVTANRLGDGVVVYLAADEAADDPWVERLEQARVANGKQESEALLALAEEHVRACRVVTPYLIDVSTGEDGVLMAASCRELMRALGPSVRLDLGKQAEQG